MASSSSDEVKPNSGDEVSLDINEIAQSMKSRIEMLEPLSPNCCIYIVPPRLRMANKEMYTPQIFSIGPFHHRNEELKAMEEHKLRYLSAFLDRIGISIEQYYDFLKQHEISLRESYVQINGYTRKEFMDIMAVDGAFLMEYLLRRNYGDWEWNDRIFEKQFLGHDVRHDLLLTENQLPFFFLEYLFKLFKESKREDTLSLKKIVQAYLSDASPWEWSKDVELITRETLVHHLLHFLILCLQLSQSPNSASSPSNCLYSIKFSNCLQPPQSPKGGKCKSLATPTPSICESHQAGVTFKPSSSSNCLYSIKFSNCLQPPKSPKEGECKSLATRSIWELHQAGVTFKPSSSSNCLSSINFSKGILEIPKLILEDDVEKLFRNMQAFEQCHKSNNYINDYIFIMDVLINKGEDVLIFKMAL